jgi:hypothetical protein
MRRPCRGTTGCRARTSDCGQRLSLPRGTLILRLTPPASLLRWREPTPSRAAEIQSSRRSFGRASACQPADAKNRAGDGCSPKVFGCFRPHTGGLALRRRGTRRVGGHVMVGTAGRETRSGQSPVVGFPPREHAEPTSETSYDDGTGRVPLPGRGRSQSRVAATWGRCAAE